MEGNNDSVIHVMTASSEPPTHHDKPAQEQKTWGPILKKWCIFMGCWEVLMIILLSTLTEYGEGADPRKADPTNLNPVLTSSYSFFQDVHVMIFVGFGFLMTFLRRYAFGALGYTLCIACMCIQYHSLINGLWHNLFADTDAFTHKIPFDLGTLLLGDFAAGSVLITFGALLGKVNILQMTVIALIEVTLFALNENIAVKLGVVDIGGSMVIHQFGAYFGLACTLFASRPHHHGREKNGSSYTSDTFAMVGTIFLFMFWPSFNGAPASSGTQQQRAVVNTVLGMTGSVMAAFICSPIFREGHKFNMVDIQNATIAGGVALGSIADMMVTPGIAVLVGFLGGILSVFGYTRVLPFLEKKIGLQDTCGIHNLHGMPAVMSSLFSVLFSAIATPETYGTDFGNNFPKRVANGRSAASQAVVQLAVLGITFAIAIFGGSVSGLLARTNPLAGEESEPFEDEEAWDVEG